MTDDQSKGNKKHLAVGLCFQIFN